MVNGGSGNIMGKGRLFSMMNLALTRRGCGCGYLDCRCRGYSNKPKKIRPKSNHTIRYMEAE